MTLLETEEYYSFHELPSSCKRNFLASIPSPKPDNFPDLAITLWQGTMMAIGLHLLALPTARAAFALPTSFACCW